MAKIHTQGVFFCTPQLLQRGLTLCGTDEGNRYATVTPISMLPDNILLEIFDFCRENHYNHPTYSRPLREWNIIVHVCSRWRQIVFASPQRLNLQILCTYGTPVKKILEIWPTLPISLDLYSLRSHTSNDEENAIIALKHPDRVSSVMLYVTGSQFGNIVTVMQEPFPMLARLYICLRNGNAAVLPASFLGGSAPRLQELYLSRIPYPTLPTLLLSASDLVDLRLQNIPPTGYISPKAMVMGLAALPHLQNLFIEFESQSATTPHPDQTYPPSRTRTVLPVLTSFNLQAAYEYQEDLISQIEGPQLNLIFTVYLDRPVDFQLVQLSKFIHRSLSLELNPLRRALVSFSDDRVAFTLYRQTNYQGRNQCPVVTNIKRKAFDWPLSETAQVLGQFLSSVIHLKLEVSSEEYYQLLGAEDVEWPHLFHQFPAMQTLHVSPELARLVAIALEKLTAEIVAEASPSLDLICLEGQPASSVQNFITARQLSDRLVAVVDTEAEFLNRLDSYVTANE